MQQTVVLAHGIFNSSYVFWYLKKQLEAEGYECFAPSFSPRDGRAGIAHWAQQLGQLIDSACATSASITLVGFSMGGIVSRYYLQKLGGSARVKTFIGISVPHHGSYLSYCYPGKGTRQLRPHSSLLNELNSCEETLAEVDLYSFWTPFDLMIVPATSSVWPAAENWRFYSPLHLHMLFNHRVIDAIKRVLQS